MIIRLEKETDYQETENLTREAFWNVYRPGCFEHYLLHQLRQEKCFIPELNYVIEEDHKIIAHIAYAKGTLVKSDGTTADSVLFGPVSVRPDYQKKGYGSALIAYTLNEAAKMGIPTVVITGNPQYYQRFGFEPAMRHGIQLAGARTDFPFFMVKILDDKKAKTFTGIHHDPACYDVDEKEVDSFDSRFPKKEKKILPGQLK